MFRVFSHFWYSCLGSLIPNLRISKQRLNFSCKDYRNILIDFLNQMAKRVQSNGVGTNVVKNLNESWLLKVKESSQDVNEEDTKMYEEVVQQLEKCYLYEPVDLCDLEPVDKEKRRKWLNEMEL